LSSFIQNMMLLKVFIAVAPFSLFVCSVLGQDNPCVNLGEKKKFPIDYRMLAEFEPDLGMETLVEAKNEKLVHKCVARFKNYSNADSVQIMIRYSVALYQYNKTRYADALNRLAILENAELGHYRKMLRGSWKPGNVRVNPADINTTCQAANEKLLVSGQNLSLYNANNDSLLRQTGYILHGIKSDGTDWRRQRFVLELSDTHEKWRIYFIPTGGSVPCNKIAKEPHLYITYGCDSINLGDEFFLVMLFFAILQAGEVIIALVLRRGQDLFQQCGLVFFK
jgi:hypothetical protein